MSTHQLFPDEAGARALLMVQALETQPEPGPLWSSEDRTWATRLTRQTAQPAARAEVLLAERCRHVLQRLQLREPALTAALAARPYKPVWLLLAVLLGLLLGLVVDAVGSSQHINLLAPPVWGVIAWNLAVFVGLALPLRGLGWPRWLPGLLARAMAQTASASGPGGVVLRSWQALWTEAAAALQAARAARLVHAAAAALALGMIASLYLRGLVLDYRAGWESTFLSVEQVHAALAFLLWPASAATGIAVPEVAALQALRVGPGGVPSASAAPWIHLYATMLGMFVVLPRMLLALWAGARAAGLSRRLPLPAGSVYIQRLLHELRGDASRVQVLPQGGAPSSDALAALRSVLRAGLGDAVQVDVAPVVGYGDEDQALPTVPEGTSLLLLLADLGSTPEDDTHGRLVQGVRAAVPGASLVLALDEASFAARFSALPARVAERRAVWQRWAQGQRLPLLVFNLARPDVAAHAAALVAAVQAVQAVQAGSSRR